jgi:hypothetical protein
MMRTGRVGKACAEADGVCAKVHWAGPASAKAMAIRNDDRIAVSDSGLIGVARCDNRESAGAALMAGYDTCCFAPLIIDDRM